jgi:hypothetical protein
MKKAIRGPFFLVWVFPMSRYRAGGLSLSESVTLVELATWRRAAPPALSAKLHTSIYDKYCLDEYNMLIQVRDRSVMFQ